jgi:hypothetical protein
MRLETGYDEGILILLVWAHDTELIDLIPREKAMLWFGITVCAFLHHISGHQKVLHGIIP